MNAMAVLTVGTTENVLWLPAEALAEQGFKTVVYTGFDAKTGELTGPVEVVTGVSDGDKVEIVSWSRGRPDRLVHRPMRARKPRSSPALPRHRKPPVPMTTLRATKLRP